MGIKASMARLSSLLRQCDEELWEHLEARWELGVPAAAELAAACPQRLSCLMTSTLAMAAGAQQGQPAVLRLPLDYIVADAGGARRLPGCAGCGAQGWLWHQCGLKCQREPWPHPCCFLSSLARLLRPGVLLSRRLTPLGQPAI